MTAATRPVERGRPSRRRRARAAGYTICAQESPLVGSIVVLYLSILPLVNAGLWGLKA